MFCGVRFNLGAQWPPPQDASLLPVTDGLSAGDFAFSFIFLACPVV